MQLGTYARAQNLRTHARVLRLAARMQSPRSSLAPRALRRLATVLRGLLPYKAYYVVQSKTSTKRQLGIIRLSHICCSIMLLLLFTLQRLSTSNYYFSASTTLCKSCLLLKTGLVINRTLVPLVFFSFLTFALLLVYEILGISLCHLA